MSYLIVLVCFVEQGPIDVFAQCVTISVSNNNFFNLVCRLNWLRGIDPLEPECYKRP
jgi:hypothetical protein